MTAGKDRHVGKLMQMLRGMNSQLFGSGLELKVRLFNGLAVVGTCVGMITTLAALFIDPDLYNILINLVIALASLSILLLSVKTGRYKLCYLLTIIMIFGGLFTGLFVTSGAYKGGMPLYFLMAILYTVYMLRGKLGVFVSLLEMIWYVGLLLLSLHYPDLFHWFATEDEIVSDVMLSFVITATALGLTQALENRIYDRQQSQLNAALAAKNQFLGSVSHEVRTPINMILGMNQMIIRENTDPIINEYAHRIESSGNYMLDLVDSLLDMSKIESGRMELVVRAYEPTGMFRLLFTEFRRQAEEKGLRFTYRVGELPDHLMGDALNIRQIMSNIITNALKYTVKGQISVWVSYEEGNLEFEVKDTGIGIRPEKIDSIFDTFVRAGQDSGVSVDGVGLGLSIVKRLVDMMGGTISVESEYGEGSLFSVTIPQAIASELEAEEEEAASEEDLYIPDVRILSCDDREENLYVLESLLQHTGASITSASGGRKCLDALQTGSFDIILLDYMMPEMDGVETLKRIRQLPNGQHVTVVAVTADVQTSTKRYLITSGFDDYLRKPVSIEALHRLLRQHISPEKIQSQVKKAGHCELIDKEEVQAKMKRLDVDLEKGLSTHGNHMEEYYQVCRIFRQYFRSSMDDMITALREAQITDYRSTEASTEASTYSMGQKNAAWNYAAARIAHSLKSSARNVGAGLLSAEAEQFERKCLENDTDYVRIAWPLLQMQWQRAADAAAVLCEHMRIEEPEAKKAAVHSAELTDEEKAKQKAELISNLRETLRRYEGFRAEQIRQALTHYADSPSEQECLEQIRECIENVDFSEAEALMEDFLRNSGEI